MSKAQEANMKTASSTAGSESVSNTYLKYFSLVSLTVQNALLILTMRYVRTRTGDMFMASTAVIMSESLKFLSSLLIIFIQEGSLRSWLKHLNENIFHNLKDCLKISVPGLIYTLQNNLLYLALSNLDAATFQVLYQMKILTTALFSVLMLKKQLSKLQWLSLIFLMAGVVLVELQPENTQRPKESTIQNPLIGFVAVLIYCIMSGFAGVYFEKILKGTQQTVWLRNVQLGFLGAVFGLITMEIKDGSKVRSSGFFFGYDIVVWCVILLQCFGGLVVAVVVKYADNILKGFATSAAIIISCVASVYFFYFQISVQFVLGATFVIVSIYMYGKFVPELKVPVVVPNGISKV
ncbi:hypothetical protein CHS0354_029616 [Potamilus streckersoni]|uniref:UDP-N-acetylglucosamine transporter n=1 Tax=Potamilus streckersoni TaxID=2493646 RepID=A0AAE0VJS8_9BIVA|nr:hypothetical protein CHS0354_029616 [Potamilus streckersoni]